MELRDGRSPETAFIIEDSSGEMTASIGEMLDEMFGGSDGNYFVHSETTLERKDDEHRYKVLFIEDSNNERRTVYFEIK